MVAQDVLPVMPSELTALIRMRRDCLLGSTTPQGHHQRIEHQAGIDAATSRCLAGKPGLNESVTPHENAAFQRIGY